VEHLDIITETIRIMVWRSRGRLAARLHNYLASAAIRRVSGDLASSGCARSHVRTVAKAGVQGRARPQMRGDGRTFRRGSVFWIAYYAPRAGRSVEHREPAGKTEAEAKRLLKRRQQEIAVHRSGIRAFGGPQQEKVTVEEILTGLERDYEIRGRRALPQLRSHLVHVRAFFGMDRAVAINGRLVRDYVKQRQDAGAAAATINHEVKALARALSLSVEVGLLNHAPKLPLLREQNARQGFFERAEFEAVLAAIRDTDLRDFCEWFYLTGMRPGEIRSLVWEGFDSETMTLRLHARDAKTGYGRGLSLEGGFRKLIERRLAARRLDTNLIFHRGGAPVGDFRKTWQAACVVAKVGQQVELPNGKTRYVGKRLYDLRRTAVRNMVRAGVPERVAMEISGHRTRATFDRYNITSERDMREALARTSAYVDSLPTKPAAAPLRRG
jgi:integrase